MYILDAIIIIILILGVLSGIKRGLLKTLVLSVGLILCLIIAFYLKNPISEFFYTNLPFFELKGIFKGVSALNIIIYEAIAFIAIFSILYLVLRIIIKITGLLENLLKLTVILGFFSKIGGAIVGFVEGYILVFIVLFIFTQPIFTIKGIEESKLSDKILSITPVLSNAVEPVSNAIDEIYELNTEYKDDKPGYNKRAVELLLEYKIIDEENVEILKKKGKLSY